MNKSTIAYFSAEYSVADSLPIYAGGLGILAGDTVMEAGSEKADFHAFGLVYHEAFTAGDTDTRPMTERLQAEGFALLTTAGTSPRLVEVMVGGEPVMVQAWRKNYGPASLTLLDTRLAANHGETARITDHLYDSTPGMMLRQQLVLGLGSVALLDQLGLDPDAYHLNEGHMSFVGLGVALRYQRLHPETNLVTALAAVKPKLVATKHTILPGAGLTLGRADLESALAKTLAAANGTVDDLLALGAKTDGYFSTTRFLLAIASRHSGVSEIHVRAEAETHPGSPLQAITNGVFVPRWRSKELGPTPLELSDDELWTQHQAGRQALVDYVSTETGQQLDSHRLTVVWARRMTAYKRPELLVSDLDRLITLASDSQRPVQFVVAGKANPADAVGIELMNRVVAAAGHPELANSFAYLPHYNPMTARLLVQGADLWLNTPVRGQEACGTSGMKASLNGALQFSTSDGWIDEIDPGPIGWVVPVEASGPALYDTLEQQITPLFYERAAGRPDAWIIKMRANIELIERRFTATRMLHDYYAKLYIAHNKG